jgi:sRNA-binding carbon storage regulator CsrA
VAVHREEIYEKIREENRRAREVDPRALREVADLFKASQKRKRGREGS